ncbi:MAG: ribosome maturation factor RimM [Desulfurivibrio sp.]|nr:ribosome maturation factor RimM [Desulfurivibrio sp.]
MKIRFVGYPRDDELLEVGRVVKPQGIKGELKIVPYSGRPADFREYRHLWPLGPLGAEAPAGGWGLLAARESGGAVIARLAGITDRDAAEALRGRPLAIRSRELPPAPAGELYWHWLSGLPARDEQGRQIGTVADLLATPARPTMVIADAAGREILVPVHAEFMQYQPAVAGRAAFLLLTPPPGLLEL